MYNCHSDCKKSFLQFSLHSFIHSFVQQTLTKCPNVPPGTVEDRGPQATKQRNEAEISFKSYVPMTHLTQVPMEGLLTSGFSWKPPGSPWPLSRLLSTCLCFLPPPNPHLHYSLCSLCPQNTRTASLGPEFPS